MAKKAAPKAAAKSAAPAPAAAPAKKASAARVKSATKAEIYTSLADKTGLSKKQVSGVFQAMGELITKELGKKGPGIFVIPGLLKLKVVDKKASKEKQVPSPFKPGELMTIKAKPARRVIKAQPMKSLKDSV